jgi:ABC-type branched-subunit amino acid transport system substrate-binding protein
MPILKATAVAALLAAGHAGAAEKAYGPGVTDTEIKLGQTMAYSGPASAYGVVGRVQTAYFNMLNAQGGVNGRKINFISLDDGYSPPKTVEQVRKLVEEEKVLAIFSLLGSPGNIAVSKYLNAQKVPQLLSQAGTALIDDPKNLPWTTAFTFPQRTEARVLVAYLLQTKPDAKVGIIYQNDEYGKGYLRLFKEAFGDKGAKMIVKEVSYDLTDPTIDSQILSLQASGADTVLNATTPRFSAQAIRKIYDIGWKPLHIMIYAASSVPDAMRPAGPERGVGTVTVQYFKLPDDPTWADDKAMVDYHAFLKQWAPNENMSNPSAVIGYIAAQFMVEVLKRCGDDLTRENVLKQATSFNDVPLPMLLPGVGYTATPTDHTPFHAGRMFRFDGTRWVSFGDVVKAVF